MKVLAQAFIVAEQKGFIRTDWAAKRGAKLIALERRSRALIEIVG